MRCSRRAVPWSVVLSHRPANIRTTSVPSLSRPECSTISSTRIRFARPSSAPTADVVATCAAQTATTSLLIPQSLSMRFGASLRDTGAMESRWISMSPLALEELGTSVLGYKTILGPVCMCFNSAVGYSPYAPARSIQSHSQSVQLRSEKIHISRAIIVQSRHWPSLHTLRPALLTRSACRAAQAT